MNNKSNSLWNRLSRQLGAKLGIGIITIVPFVATIWILYQIFIRVDAILQPVIKLIVGRTIPGAGFAITTVLILLVGFVASNVIGKSILRYVEKVIPAMPVFRQLYTSIKQIMESFSAPRGAGRMQPVFIEFPQKGMKALGFITSELCNEAGKKLYVVFIPTVPTPTGGFMQIVEESEIIRTDMSLEKALEMVISAGTVVPPEVISALFSSYTPKVEK